MFSTRSISPVAQVTDLILVSHGSPSEPAPQEDFIKDLAAKVAMATGLNVRGATLAAEGALDTAVEGVGRPTIFPHFMADGWFASCNLPKRLQEAGLRKWSMMRPLGMQEALIQFAEEGLAACLSNNGLRARESSLVIAAHGSPSDPRAARATSAFATRISASAPFADVRIGYVDEAPYLDKVLNIAGPSIVLPFFAAKAGHVLMDLPEAIESAGYGGVVMDPIGVWPGIAGLISRVALTDIKVSAA